MRFAVRGDITLGVETRRRRVDGASRAAGVTTWTRARDPRPSSRISRRPSARRRRPPSSRSPTASCSPSVIEWDARAPGPRQSRRTHAPARSRARPSCAVRRAEPDRAPARRAAPRRPRPAADDARRPALDRARGARRIVRARAAPTVVRRRDADRRPTHAHRGDRRRGRSRRPRRRDDLARRRLGRMRDALGGDPPRLTTPPRRRSRRRARPRPGGIRVSTGQVVALDRTVVIGRRPRSTRVTGTDLPHLVAVDSPQQDISRSHVELRVEGDSILATDLHTTNGTTLLRAGRGPDAAAPGRGDRRRARRRPRPRRRHHRRRRGVCRELQARADGAARPARASPTSTSLGSGGFADVYLYEQQLPKRRVAVKVLLTERMSSGSVAEFTAEANVMAMLSTHPADRHDLPGRRRPRRPAVPRHGVLPEAEPAGALPPRAVLGRRVAARRHPGRRRGRDRAPRGRAAPRHQAREHPRHRVQPAGAHRLRHRVDDERRRGVRRAVDPVVAARVVRRRAAQRSALRRLRARRDRLHAARRTLAVRAARPAQHRRRAHRADRADAAARRSAAPTRRRRWSARSSARWRSRPADRHESALAFARALQKVQIELVALGHADRHPRRQRRRRRSRRGRRRAHARPRRRQHRPRDLARGRAHPPLRRPRRRAARARLSARRWPTPSCAAPPTRSEATLRRDRSERRAAADATVLRLPSAVDAAGSPAEAPAAREPRPPAPRAFAPGAVDRRSARRHWWSSP